MSDYLVSLIRTVVPVGVAVVLSWLANVGVDVDSTEATQFLTGLAVAVYYAVVRAVELRVPWVGWLLGMPKPPSYG